MGWGQFKTACTLWLYMATPSGLIIYPRNVNKVWWNSHFSAFAEMGNQMLKDSSNMINVSWGNLSKLKYHQYYDQSVEHVAEDITDEGLRHWGTIDQPEWHDPVLVVPRHGGVGRFPFIPFSNTDQVIGTAYVQFCEIFGWRSRLIAAGTNGKGY